MVGGWVALEEWKLRLTSAKVEVEVEAELGNKQTDAQSHLLTELLKGVQHGSNVARRK